MLNRVRERAVRMEQVWNSNFQVHGRLGTLEDGGL
jgi:hypothetical protein